MAPSHSGLRSLFGSAPADAILACWIRSPQRMRAPASWTPLAVRPPTRRHWRENSAIRCWLPRLPRTRGARLPGQTTRNADAFRSEVQRRRLIRFPRSEKEYRAAAKRGCEPRRAHLDVGRRGLSKFREAAVTFVQETHQGDCHPCCEQSAAHDQVPLGNVTVLMLFLRRLRRIAARRKRSGRAGDPCRQITCPGWCTQGAD